MEEVFGVLLVIAAGAYFLIGPGFGISAWRSLRREDALKRELRDRLQAQEETIARLSQAVAALRAAGPIAAPPAGEPAAEAVAPPLAEPIAAASSAAETPPVSPEPAPETPSEPTEPPTPIEEPAAAPAPVAAAARDSFEQRLTSRWLVWLGAVTMALGGTFLVKYSIDYGWLGPTARVLLGFLIGCALVGGGDWLRRRPDQMAVAALRANYVPPALTAAGLFTGFGSVYAAFGLYDLISPLVAFVLLAALVAAAVALSILQGPFIALLGIIGGFVTPMLIPSDAPSAWGLFTYLLLLIAGSLAVVRIMVWWWVAWAAIAGVFLWVFVWFAGGIWKPGDALPIGVFLVLTAAAFIATMRREGAPVPALTWQDRISLLIMPEGVVYGATSVIALLVFMLVRMDGYGTTSLVVLAVIALLYLLAGRRDPAHDRLSIVAAVLTLFAIAAWHLPQIITEPTAMGVVEGRPTGFVPGPIVPPELMAFLGVTAGFAALFGIGGFLALWSAARQGLWAALSAAMPVALLAIAYWRILDFATDLRWAAIALALAGVFVVAVQQLRPRRGDPGFDEALGAYSLAVVASLGLAATMALQEAWLTVALALQLPALAWIHLRLNLASHRRIAKIVATIVLARLVLNPEIFSYSLGRVPGLNWVLYGYGIPAAAFFVASRWFAQTARDRVVLLLESGALVFAVLLVTLEIRSLVTGPLDREDYPLLEQSLQSIAWLAIAFALLLQDAREPRPVTSWGWRILAGLGAAQVLVLQLLVFNPRWNHTAVGSLPIFNLLLLAYAVPAAFALVFAWQLRRQGQAQLALAAGAIGFVLSFAYVTFELRHAFQGTFIDARGRSDAEWYAYSALWLAYGGVLLALGIHLRSAYLRYASLAVVMLTVAKVFITDMADLQDLWRVASFMGLGLCLVGIGYLYQRFVFPIGAAPAAPAPPAVTQQG